MSSIIIERRRKKIDAKNSRMRQFQFDNGIFTYFTCLNKKKS